MGGDGLYLEEGSGLSYVYRNLLTPELRERWVQMEWNKSLKDESLMIDSDMDIRVGTAYNTPFKPDTFGLVFDMSLYDLLDEDLTGAFRDKKAILKPGCRFVHVTPQIPRHESIDRQLQRTEWGREMYSVIQYY